MARNAQSLEVGRVEAQLFHLLWGAGSLYRCHVVYVHG